MAGGRWPGRVGKVGGNIGSIVLFKCSSFSVVVRVARLSYMGPPSPEWCMGIGGELTGSRDETSSQGVLLGSIYAERFVYHRQINFRYDSPNPYLWK